MKNLSFFLLLAISLSFMACEKNILFDPSSSDCLLQSHNIDGETSLFEYNNDLLVFKITEGDTYEVSFSYDSEGKLKKTEFYEHEELIDYQTFTWTSNSMTMNDFGFNNEINLWEETDWKLLYDFNDDGQVIKITEFSKVNNQWIEAGDYYKFYWTNDNLTKVENLDNYSNSKLKIKKNNPMDYLDFSINVEKFAHPKSSKSDYSVNSTINIEYDDKISPFHSQAFVNIYNPIDLNYSLNNPIKKEETYSNYPDEIRRSSYSYTYNDKNFPKTMFLTNVIISQNDTHTEEEHWTFEYDCE